METLFDKTEMLFVCHTRTRENKILKFRFLIFQLKGSIKYLQLQY
jgi:hypothetical protein